MICMENINVDKVFQDYGLEVQQVEPYVYKVLNTEKEISVDELQKDLECCVLLTSERKGKKRLSTYNPPPTFRSTKIHTDTLTHRHSHTDTHSHTDIQIHIQTSYSGHF